MIVIDIGHTFIKTYDNSLDFYDKCKLRSNLINEFIQNIINSNKDELFWIGSVNIDFYNKIEKIFIDNNIKYKCITCDFFKKYVKINENIDYKEIGLDILSICFYVDKKNYMFISSGSAIVNIKFTDKLEGVIISPNYFINLDKLCKKTNLSYTFSPSHGYGTNTSDSLNAGLNNWFKLSLENLLEINPDIKHIFSSGIKKDFFNVNNIHIDEFYIEPTIKGYIKLIKLL